MGGAAGTTPGQPRHGGHLRTGQLLLLLLLALAPSFVSTECPYPGDFQCVGEDRCVPHSFVCDGDSDCDLGSDENVTLCNSDRPSAPDLPPGGGDGDGSGEVDVIPSTTRGTTKQTTPSRGGEVVIPAADTSNSTGLSSPLPSPMASESTGAPNNSTASPVAPIDRLPPDNTPTPEVETVISPASTTNVEAANLTTTILGAINVTTTTEVSTTTTGNSTSSPSAVPTITTLSSASEGSVSSTIAASAQQGNNATTNTSTTVTVPATVTDSKVMPLPVDEGDSEMNTTMSTASSQPTAMRGDNNGTGNMSTSAEPAQVSMSTPSTTTTTIKTTTLDEVPQGNNMTSSPAPIVDMSTTLAASSSQPVATPMPSAGVSGNNTSTTLQPTANVTIDRGADEGKTTTVESSKLMNTTTAVKADVTTTSTPQPVTTTTEDVVVIVPTVGAAAGSTNATTIEAQKNATESGNVTTPMIQPAVSEHTKAPAVESSSAQTSSPASSSQPGFVAVTEIPLGASPSNEGKLNGSTPESPTQPSVTNVTTTVQNLTTTTSEQSGNVDVEELPPVNTTTPAAAPPSSTTTEGEKSQVPTSTLAPVGPIDGNTTITPGQNSTSAKITTSPMQSVGVDEGDLVTPIPTTTTTESQIMGINSTAQPSITNSTAMKVSEEQPSSVAGTTLLPSNRSDMSIPTTAGQASGISDIPPRFVPVSNVTDTNVTTTSQEPTLSALSTTTAMMNNATTMAMMNNATTTAMMNDATTTAMMNNATTTVMMNNTTTTVMMNNATTTTETPTVTTTSVPQPDRTIMPTVSIGNNSTVDNNVTENTTQKAVTGDSIRSSTVLPSDSVDNLQASSTVMTEVIGLNSTTVSNATASTTPEVVVEIDVPLGATPPSQADASSTQQTRMNSSDTTTASMSVSGGLDTKNLTTAPVMNITSSTGESTPQGEVVSPSMSSSAVHTNLTSTQQPGDAGPTVIPGPDVMSNTTSSQPMGITNSTMQLNVTTTPSMALNASSSSAIDMNMTATSKQPVVIPSTTSLNMTGNITTTVLPSDETTTSTQVSPNTTTSDSGLISPIPTIPQGGGMQTNNTTTMVTKGTEGNVTSMPTIMIGVNDTTKNNMTHTTMSGNMTFSTSTEATMNINVSTTAPATPMVSAEAFANGTSTMVSTLKGENATIEPIITLSTRGIEESNATTTSMQSNSTLSSNMRSTTVSPIAVTNTTQQGPTANLTVVATPSIISNTTVLSSETVQMNMTSTVQVNASSAPQIVTSSSGTMLVNVTQTTPQTTPMSNQSDAFNSTVGLQSNMTTPSQQVTDGKMNMTTTMQPNLVMPTEGTNTTVTDQSNATKGMDMNLTMTTPQPTPVLPTNSTTLLSVPVTSQPGVNSTFVVSNVATIPTNATYSPSPTDLMNNVTTVSQQNGTTIMPIQTISEVDLGATPPMSSEVPTTHTPTVTTSNATMNATSSVTMSSTESPQNMTTLIQTVGSIDVGATPLPPSRDNTSTTTTSMVNATVPTTTVTMSSTESPQNMTTLIQTVGSIDVGATPLPPSRDNTSTTTTSMVNATVPTTTVTMSSTESPQNMTTLIQTVGSIDVGATPLPPSQDNTSTTTTSMVNATVSTTTVTMSSTESPQNMTTLIQTVGSIDVGATPLPPSLDNTSTTTTSMVNATVSTTTVTMSSIESPQNMTTLIQTVGSIDVGATPLPPSLDNTSTTTTSMVNATVSTTTVTMSSTESPQNMTTLIQTVGRIDVGATPLPPSLDNTSTTTTSMVNATVSTTTVTISSTESPQNMTTLIQTVGSIDVGATPLPPSRENTSTTTTSMVNATVPTTTLMPLNETTTITMVTPSTSSTPVNVTTTAPMMTPTTTAVNVTMTTAVDTMQNSSKPSDMSNMTTTSMATVAGQPTTPNSTDSIFITSTMGTNTSQVPIIISTPIPAESTTITSNSTLVASTPTPLPSTTTTLSSTSLAATSIPSTPAPTTTPNATNTPIPKTTPIPITTPIPTTATTSILPTTSTPTTNATSTPIPTTSPTPQATSVLPTTVTAATTTPTTTSTTTVIPSTTTLVPTTTTTTPMPSTTVVPTTTPLPSTAVPTIASLPPTTPVPISTTLPTTTTTTTTATTTTTTTTTTTPFPTTRQSVGTSTTGQPEGRAVVKTQMRLTDGVEWTDDLSDPSSAAYLDLRQNLDSSVTSALTAGGLDPDRFRLTNYQFRKGSVVASFDIESLSEEPVSSSDVGPALKKGIEEGAMRGFTVDTTSLAFQDAVVPLTEWPPLVQAKAPAVTEYPFPDWAIGLVLAAGILFVFIILCAIVVCCATSSRRDAQEAYSVHRADQPSPSTSDGGDSHTKDSSFHDSSLTAKHEPESYISLPLQGKPVPRNGAPAHLENGRTLPKVPPPPPKLPPTSGHQADNAVGEVVDLSSVFYVDETATLPLRENREQLVDALQKNSSVDYVSVDDRGISFTYLNDPTTKTSYDESAEKWETYI